MSPRYRIVRLLLRTLLQSIVVLSAIVHPQIGRGSDPDRIGINEVRWGFDGTIQRQSFVPVSVEVQNGSASVWSGEIQLSQSMTDGKQIGLNLSETLTLQPNERRWIQFFPYLIDEYSNWAVHWGPEKQHRYVLPSPSAGPPPTVLIYDRDAAFAPDGLLRRLPADLFPNSVTGTDALRGVIFAEAPFWQGSRPHAFLEWLSRGGKVFLLHSRDGRYATFPAPLEVLNQAGEKFAVGNGVVQRIPLKPGDITLEFAQKYLFADGLRPRESPFSNFIDPRMAFGSFVPWDRHRPIFETLQRFATFSRPWWLIYLAAFFYLLILGRVCYRIGTEGGSLQRFYATFFGASGLFGILFLTLGQLGASVPNRIYSGAIAECLEPGVFNVTQWSQLAAAHPGWHEFQDHGSGHCYSTCQESTTVLGTATGGRTSHVRLKLPPASTQQLLHRFRWNAAERTFPQITKMERLGGELSTFNVAVNQAVPGRIQQVAALYQRQLYKLEQSGSTWQLRNLSRPEPLEEAFLKVIDKPAAIWFGGPRSHPSPWKNLPAQDAIFYPLLANSLGLQQGWDPQLLQAPPGTVRILIQTDWPDELKATSDTFTEQIGAMLHSFDLPETGQPN